MTTTDTFNVRNSVFAGVDVRCAEIQVIDQYLRVLAEDSELLGSYLAALGAKAATPTLW